MRAQKLESSTSCDSCDERPAVVELAIDRAGSSAFEYLCAECFKSAIEEAQREVWS